MTKTRFNPRLISGGVQVLALLVLLYFLNVLFQTQFYLPLPIIAELTVGILWLFLCYALSRTFGILTILGLSFAASLLWGFFLESVPASDFLNFYEGAVHVSLGEFDQLFAGKSATTVGYYAIFHWLPGPSNLTNYIASSVAWTGGAALTYRTLRHFVDDERKVLFVCAGVALCPTFLVFSPVVSSESVFFLLTAVCAWLTARHLTGRGPFPYLYILLGIATAALFLTRANGLLGLFICIFAIGAGWRGSPANIGEGAIISKFQSVRHPLALCSIVVATFLVVWFAHGYLAWLSGHGFQATSSPYGSVNLIIGTSFHAEGRFNNADLELAGYKGANKLPFAQANEKARRIALERIEKNPIGFISFALTDKVAQLWGREFTLYLWALGDEQRINELNWLYFLSAAPGLPVSEVIESVTHESQPLNLRVWPLVIVSLDGVYRVTLLLFLVMLAREVRRPSKLLVLGLIVLLLSLPHIIVEVRPRFHMAMTPFIVVGSMLLAYDLWDRRREWYESVRRQKEQWLGNRSE